MKALTSLWILKEAKLLHTYKLQAPEQTEGSNFGIKSSDLSPSLFFSGKLQNYSEARQSLRLFNVFD